MKTLDVLECSDTLLFAFRSTVALVQLSLMMLFARKKSFKICSASVTFLGLISGLILNKSRLRSHYMTPINCRRKYDHL